MTGINLDEGDSFIFKKINAITRITRGIVPQTRRAHYVTEFVFFRERERERYIYIERERVRERRERESNGPESIISLTKLVLSNTIHIPNYITHSDPLRSLKEKKSMKHNALVGYLPCRHYLFKSINLRCFHPFTSHTNPYTS